MGDNKPHFCGGRMGGWVGGSPRWADRRSPRYAERLMDEAQRAKRGPPNFPISTSRRKPVSQRQPMQNCYLVGLRPSQMSAAWHLSTSPRLQHQRQPYRSGVCRPWTTHFNIYFTSPPQALALPQGRHPHILVLFCE